MAPTTRRSAGRGGKQQTTLSFNHRVTKPSSAAKSTKDRASPSPATPAKTKEEEKEEEKDEEKSEVELRALALSESDIRWHLRRLKYARVTCHAHHKGLEENERILRIWDVSSQYGPCIGITRLKRWQRAEKLGLNPPLAVLAVLLRAEEREKGAGSEQRAYIDKILNPLALAGSK